MGSIFSFVFLCIINFAVYRQSLEQRLGCRGEMKIEDCIVRVNGDDILFKADDELLSIWEKNIADVGFEKSVGKNYVSKNFAVINSTYFDLRTDEPVEIPYLNLGWVTGVQKGGGTMRLNAERTKTLTNDVRRIRPQVDQTIEDWLPALSSRRSMEEFDANLGVRRALYPIHFKRRSEILKRYRTSVWFWNREEITKFHLPLDFGPFGLGLSDRMTDDPYSNGFRAFLERSGVRGNRFGGFPVENVCPEVLGTWKLRAVDDEGQDLEALHNEYRSLTKRKKQSLHPRYRQEGLKENKFSSLLDQIRDKLRFTFSCKGSPLSERERLLGVGVGRAPEATDLEFKYIV